MVKYAIAPIITLVLMTLSCFLIMFGGFMMWSYSKGFEKNCKHCSWYEDESGLCEYNKQDLLDQEYGTDYKCADMGSYEMAWKIGMMMMFAPGLFMLSAWAFTIIDYSGYAIKLIKKRLKGGKNAKKRK